MGEDRGCKFTQLSDCLMLEILSFLDATSLYFLSQTCTYFKNIIKDRKLWKYVDARGKPNTEDKIEYCIKRIHNDTTHLMLRADSKKGNLLFFDLVPQILNCKNLTVLSLENQRFCGKKISLQDFPSTLEELSLRKTQVRNGKSFFQHSFSSKRNLRVLILDECNWLDSSFIMSVSKFPSLEIISIVKCNKLHYNIVPYLSVARQGCKKLKVLDCRFSTVGNDFLRTFDENENILALYFQSMRSYQQDYEKPLLRNTEKIQNLSPDDMDLISQSIINNRSLYNFKFALGVDCNIEELPESLLYEDPYPLCTCKYQENRNIPERESQTVYDLSPLTWKLTKKVFGNDFYTSLCQYAGRGDLEDPSNRNLMAVDDFMNFRSAAPQKFLCKKHSNEVDKLPKEFKDFFVQNQLMFHAGQTDSESGSDSDFDNDDCCMYGMGKAQQLILLRLNEIDSEGNLPEPEVIDLNAENRGMEVEVIRIDPFGSSRHDASSNRQRRSPNNEVIYRIGSPERTPADSTTEDTPNKNPSTNAPSTSTLNRIEVSPFKNIPNTNPNLPSTSRDSPTSTKLEITPLKIQPSINTNMPNTTRYNSSINTNMPSTSRDSPSASRIIEISPFKNSPSFSTDLPSTSRGNHISNQIEISPLKNNNLSISTSMPNTSKDYFSISTNMPSCSRDSPISSRMEISPLTSNLNFSTNRPDTSRDSPRSKHIEISPFKSTISNATTNITPSNPNICSINRNVTISNQDSTSTTNSTSGISNNTSPKSKRESISSTNVENSIDMPSTSIDMPSTSPCMPSTSRNSLNSSLVTFTRGDSSASSLSLNILGVPDLEGSTLDSVSKIPITRGYTDFKKSSCEMKNIGDTTKINESSLETSDVEQNMRSRKGKKRCIRSSDICEASTSSGTPDCKKPKLEKSINNVTSSDDNVTDERGESEEGLMDGISKPVLPDSQSSSSSLPKPLKYDSPQVLERRVLPAQEVDHQDPQDHSDDDDTVNIDLPPEIRLVRFPPQEEHKQKKLKLRRLSLRGYRKISDSALNYLRNLKIDLLDLTHTSVTKRGVEQFLSYNPNCRVIHKEFCVCKPRIAL